MIQALINKSVLARENHPMTHWYPSSLGMCLTGQYLQRQGVQADYEFDEDKLRMFSCGKHFEDWLVDLVKQSGAKFQTQVPAKFGDFSGLIDLVIDNMPYEIKSTNSASFKHIKKSGAKVHNEMQLWFYLYALNVPEGHLVYLDRDWLNVLEFNVYLNNEKLKGLVLGEIETLEKAWKDQVPPPCVYGEKDWQAKYCRFHESCKKFIPK